MAGKWEVSGTSNGRKMGGPELFELFGLSYVLGADLAILDEIDSGLVVDALSDVAKAVNGLLTPKNSVLMITHYRWLLEFIKPTCIHIMDDGRTIKMGDISIAKVLEAGGDKAISEL